MAVSCAWIIAEAVQRIFYRPVASTHALWPVLVLVASIGVDFWRSRQLRAVARRTGSPALATDAFHFASDIWATSAVLAGLGATWLGTRFGIGALHYADPFAAVVGFVHDLRMTIRVGHEAVGALMDEIPAETRRRLVSEVERVEGVLAVERARVRRAGAGYFADLTLAMPRRFTFEHTGEAGAGGHRRGAARPAPEQTSSSTPFRAKLAPKASSIACAPWLRVTMSRCTNSASSRTMAGCRSNLHVEIEENTRAPRGA